MRNEESLDDLMFPLFIGSSWWTFLLGGSGLLYPSALALFEFSFLRPFLSFVSRLILFCCLSKKIIDDGTKPNRASSLTQLRSAI